MNGRFPPFPNSIASSHLSEYRLTIFFGAFVVPRWIYTCYTFLTLNTHRIHTSRVDETLLLLPPMIQSSPHRPSSKMAVLGPSGSAQLSQGFRVQSNLKLSLQAEIGNQTWELPALMFAQIISPKKPNSGVKTTGELLSLDCYSFAIDNPTFHDALDEITQDLQNNKFFTSTSERESAHYPSIATFLTTCVELCHDTLDKLGGPDVPPRQDRWYRDLQFTIGKPLIDKVQGSAPLKPDITGGHGISAIQDEALYWDPPKDKPTHRLVVSVEVKNNWASMVAQAATYAHGLFSADTARTFAPVLAFNHRRKEMRFLAFHRGGLTASVEIDLTEPGELKGFVQIFFALALGSTPVDAGFLTCFNGTEYKLPTDKEGASYRLATLEGILSDSLCIRGRATFVSRASFSPGALSAITEPPSVAVEPSSSGPASSSKSPVIPAHPKRRSEPETYTTRTIRHSPRIAKRGAAGKKPGLRARGKTKAPESGTSLVISKGAGGGYSHDQCFNTR